MIGLRVNVEYEPTLTKAEQIVLKLPNKLANLRPFMINNVAPAVNRMLLRHWESNGAAFGRRWAPWKPATRAKRIAKGNEGKGLLRDTDHLFKTLFRSRPTDSRLRKIKDGLRLSLNLGVRYAIFHQEGTEFMAERQVIPDPLPRVFMKEVRVLFSEYLRQ